MPNSFLKGVRVVTVEQAVAAPFCSRRLAQAGADVIKVERPDGDFARSYDTAVGGHSSYFVWLNHSKRSIALDLKTDQGVDQLRRLIATADILIQNLKPGSLGKLGLDLADLRAEHPRLITCSIAGYGSEGPSATKKAYDLLIQAESGLASITGSHHAPGRVGVSVCDIACGMFAYEAILGALIARARDDDPQRHIEVSLFDAMAEWMAVPYLLERYGGTAPGRIGIAHPGIAPYGTFSSADGVTFVLAVQNEREWQSLCAEWLGEPLASDPRARSNESRVEHRDFVDGVIAKRSAEKTYQELGAVLTRAAIAHAPVNDVSALKRHPDFKTFAVELGSQTIELPRTPGHQTPNACPHVPELGEHTGEILNELTRARPASDQGQNRGKPR